MADSVSSDTRSNGLVHSDTYQETALWSPLDTHLKTDNKTESHPFTGEIPSNLYDYMTELPTTSVHYKTKLMSKNKNYLRLCKVLLKKQDLTSAGVEGSGITRTHIIEEMKKERVDGSIIFRYENCIEFSNVRRCDSCDTIEYTGSLCMNKLCPVCGEYRVIKIKKEYRATIRTWNRPKMLTVAIGRIKNKEEITFWRTKIRKLIKKLQNDERNYIRSAIVVPEFSPSMHFHFHILIDEPRYIPNAKIRLYWDKITHGSKEITDIRSIKSSKVLKYVIKYTCKTPEFDNSEHYIKYYLMTKHTNMLSTIGIIRKSKSPKPKGKNMTCKACNIGVMIFSSSWTFDKEFLEETKNKELVKCH